MRQAASPSAAFSPRPLPAAARPASRRSPAPSRAGGSARRRPEWVGAARHWRYDTWYSSAALGWSEGDE